MALITAQNFNLTPNLVGAASGGLRLGQDIRTTREAMRQQEAQEQIRGILGQQQAPTEQQALLAEQSMGLGEDTAIAQVAPTQAQLQEQARQIDPIIAEQTFKAVGMSDKAI